jgi:hypothetical protein
MKLTVTWVDYNPPELERMLPVAVTLLRELPGPDRPDYWLGKLENPVAWTKEGDHIVVDHIVVCARWQGTRIEPLARDLPINIAYVIDPSQIEDPSLNFAKTEFVAIGGANISEGSPITASPSLSEIKTGRIAPGFGLGKAD